jgi:hypothetical protein
LLLKEVYGWDHETALIEYLQQHSEIRRSLGFDSVPDQSTLWRIGTSASAPTPL